MISAIKLILLLICSILYLFDFILLIMTNKSMYANFNFSAKRIKNLNFITLLLGGVILILSFVMSISYIIKASDYSYDTICLSLIGALIYGVFLISKRIQNKGLKDIIHKDESLQKSRNTIMFNISHEIRTPLNTILGLTEIVSRRDDLSKKSREDLDNIADAGNILLNVVNNLIDYSKIESGKFTIETYEYDTREMLQKVIDTAKKMLRNSSVEFLADIDSQIPARFSGDSVKIIQAISNLISNSCKYTHVGVITFKASYDREGDLATLRFDVEDTGVGIKKEDQANLLNIYGHTKSNGDKSSKGSGLGLYITKSIMDRMKGEISFVSEEGSGTTFTLTIPQTILSDAPVGDFSGHESKILLKNYMFTAPMAKVLVVDDNIVNLFVAKELLDNYKMEITTASSGVECLNLIKNNMYDMILMDYVMPEMNGLETLKAIRKLNGDYFKRVPIVALTAQIINGNDKGYLREGFQGYISKPINIQELEANLVDLLPEEYIVYKDDDQPQAAEKVEDKPWYARFKALLTGINLDKGLEYSNNDYTAYINLLKIVYNDSFGQSEKLRSYVKDHNLDAYRISVHAMKSVTASIGAEDLSAKFLEHEKAAKIDDYDFISSNLTQLLEEYENFINKIDLLLRKESELMSPSSAVKKEAQNSEITELATKLVQALEDYNIDDSEEILTLLEEIELDSACSRAVSYTRDLLSMFKYEEAVTTIKNEFGL